MAEKRPRGSFLPMECHCCWNIYCLEIESEILIWTWSDGGCSCSNLYRRGLFDGFRACGRLYRNNLTWCPSSRRSFDGSGGSGEGRRFCESEKSGGEKRPPEKRENCEKVDEDELLLIATYSLLCILYRNKCSNWIKVLKNILTVNGLKLFSSIFSSKLGN